MEIHNVNVSPPSERWFEPCLEIECKLKTLPNECIVGIEDY